MARARGDDESHKPTIRHLMRLWGVAARRLDPWWWRTVRHERADLGLSLV